jgi:CheY-like chemotaxis protein
MRILVVEDNLETLQLMTDVLGSFDVEVVPLSDSEQAADLINREQFDGIFLDLMMPRLDGFRLAQAIRSSNRNRTTPIVIVTGNSAPGVMQEAFHAGGSFFLSKPVDRNRLALLLNRTRGTMLSNRRGLQRIPLHVAVTREDRRAQGASWSCNVSERGILLEGDRSLHIGEELTFTFSLPHQSERIVASGVVTRLDSLGRAGIAFRQLRQTDRQRIRIYVAEETEKAHALDAESPRAVLI